MLFTDKYNIVLFHVVCIVVQVGLKVQGAFPFVYDGSEFTHTPPTHKDRKKNDDRSRRTNHRALLGLWQHLHHCHLHIVHHRDDHCPVHHCFIHWRYVVIIHSLRTNNIINLEIMQIMHVLTRKQNDSFASPPYSLQTFGGSTTRSTSYRPYRSRTRYCSRCWCVRTGIRSSFSSSGRRMPT